MAVRRHCGTLPQASDAPKQCFRTDDPCTRSFASHNLAYSLLFHHDFTGQTKQPGLQGSEENTYQASRRYCYISACLLAGIEVSAVGQTGASKCGIEGARVTGWTRLGTTSTSPNDPSDLESRSLHTRLCFALNGALSGRPEPVLTGRNAADATVGATCVMALRRRYAALSVLLALLAWAMTTHWLPTLRLLPYAFLSGCLTAIVGLLYLVSSIARNPHDHSPFTRANSLSFTSAEVWEDESLALKARLTYRRPEISKLQPGVAKQVDQLLDLILRDFIASWYGKIGRGKHFANEVDLAVRHALGRLSERLSTVDLVELGVLHVLPIINAHLEDFDRAERAVRGKTTSTDVTETEELDVAIAAKYRNGKLHPAASLASARSSAPRQKHLRSLVQTLLPSFLPGNMLTSATVLAIVREIVACAVLVPVMQALCDSDLVNQQIEAYGRSVLHERKTVRKLRAALDEHAVASPKDPKSASLPKLSPNDNERAFERFVRAIRQCTVLPEARRHRSDVSRQLERDITLHARDQTYLRRLEIAKKLLDQKVDQLQGIRPPSLDQAGNQIPASAPHTRPREHASLREILYDASGLSLFMEYMDRLNLMSFVQFWVVVDGLRGPLERDAEEPVHASSFNDSDRQDLAQVSNSYFRRTELKISRETSDAVKGFLNAGDQATLAQYQVARRAIFNAQDEIFQEMDNRHLPNFKKSDLYYRWLASDKLIRNPTPPPKAPTRPDEAGWNSPLHPRRDTIRAFGPDLRRAALSSSDLFSDGISAKEERGRRSLDENRARRPLFDDERETNTMSQISPGLQSDTESVNSSQGQSRAVDAVQAALDDLMDEDLNRESLISDTDLASSQEHQPLRASFESSRPGSRPASPSRDKPSLATLGLLGTPAKRTLFNSDDLFGENEKMWEEGRNESESSEQARENDNDDDDIIHEAAPGDLGLAEVVQGLTLELDKLEAQQSVVDSMIDKAELTNNTAELRILRKSKASLEREIRRKELQRQRYLVAESENALYGKATLSIKSIMVGTEADGHEFALYVIEVQRQSGEKQPTSSWAITRRYSEFLELHKRLRAHFPALRDIEFPRRQMVLTLQKDFLKKRRVALEKYLRHLLTIPNVCRSIEFRAFLSQQAIRPHSSGDGAQIDRQDFVTRIYNSVTDGMDEFLGNVPVLDQLSSAGQNLISAVSTSAPTTPTGNEGAFPGGLPNIESSLGNDPTTAAEAAAEISAFEAQQRSEAELKTAKAQQRPTTFIAPIAAIFQTLFQLNANSANSSATSGSGNTGYAHYLRGRAVVVILQQLLGGTVERRVRDSCRSYTSDESLSRYVELLTDLLWPRDHTSADGHGPMRQGSARRSAKAREQSRREAGVVLAALSVDVAGAVVGRSRAADAGRRIGRCLSNERLSASLMFEIIDEVVHVVFGV